MKIDLNKFTQFAFTLGALISLGIANLHGVVVVTIGAMVIALDFTAAATILLAIATLWSSILTTKL